MLRLITAVAMTLLPVVAGAEEITVTITAKDCARLLRHQPSADVAYQPGVGVKGRKVAPADLPGSGGTIQALPEVLEIPVARTALPWGNTVGVDKTDMIVGTVRYDMARGMFTYNGQPMGGTEEQAMAEACAKRGVK